MPRPATSRARGDSVWLALPLALSTLMFAPILRNYFFGDDLYNLYQIVNAPLGTYLLTPYGGHVLVARNLIFYLCYRCFTTNAAGYFWLVLLTHLLNVALLFSIIRSATNSARLAAFGAALWGSAPLQEGSLGWYSVYGNMMAGTVALWLLRDLLHDGPTRAASRRHLLVWPIALFVACTSFGVGLAIALVFPVLVLLLEQPGPRRVSAVACSLLVAVCVLPFYFAVHRLMLTPEAAAVATSTVNMETVGAWPRLLAFSNDLASYGIFSLMLRDAIAHVAYDSTRGLIAVVAVTAVCAAAFLRGNRNTRSILLASTALAVATYGVVAVGRGILWGENFFLATRYQYVPLVGVVLALCAAVASFAASIRISARTSNVLVGAWAVLATAMHFWLSPGIDHHDPARKATDIEISAMRRQIRATPAGQPVYIRNQVFHGVGPLLMRNMKAFPGWAAAFAIFFPSNVVDGRQVFFLVDDPEVLQAGKTGRRTATLLVPAIPDRDTNQ